MFLGGFGRVGVGLGCWVVGLGQGFVSTQVEWGKFQVPTVVTWQCLLSKPSTS